MYDYSEYDDPAYARGLSQKYVDYINALIEVNRMTQERAEQYFEEMDNDHLERESSTNGSAHRRIRSGIGNWAMPRHQEDLRCDRLRRLEVITLVRLNVRELERLVPPVKPLVG